MDKSDGWSVNNKDDILLVAQAAAESTEAVPVRAEPAPVAQPDSDSDSGSSSSSSSSDDDDDDDDDELFFQPRARGRPDNAEPKPAAAGEDKDEDDGDDDDDDDDEEEEDSSKTKQTVVKTKNEIARNELPEPEPWPDTVDASEAVVPVGTLCHCIDDIVTVQAFAPAGSGDGATATAGAATDAETRPVDEGSLLCFEDRVVLGRVDEVFGQVSQPCYAVRFGRTRRPDPARCKPGTKVFVATQHTTFVPVEQLMLQRGSDASNIYDEEPAPEELDYSDDEEEARAHTLLKQQFVIVSFFLVIVAAGCCKYDCFWDIQRRAFPRNFKFCTH